METNESILTREVVSLDDRKIMGKLEGLRIDCDNCAVSHFIVRNPATGSSLVLPFSRALAIGDTFLTIQNSEDILPVSQESDRVVDEGFQMVGIDVFSKTGNRLGTVDGYEFDTTFGKVTKFAITDGGEFAAESYVFFSPDFVFVDDGALTAPDLRAKPGVAAESAPAPAAAPVEKPAWFETASQQEEGAGVSQPAEAAAQTDEDEALREFLIGAVLEDDVVSEDGVFTAAKGETLTAEQVDEAAQHDALLLLTMSVAT